MWIARYVSTAMMTRLVAALAITLSAAHTLAEETKPDTRPNIIIMMADDMGFSDLGCYGSEIATPNLDQLAEKGVRFTQFYNTGRCCPTRAALLSGLYPHQAGVGHMTGNLGIPAYQGYLNDRCSTIAESLRPAGYRTLMVGKWHVGSEPGQWPNDRGFDRYFGSPNGGGVYFREALETRGEVFFTLDREKVEFPKEAYVTDLFTDHALNFIEEASQTEKPFFLYFAHIAPHWPLQAKGDDIAKYKDRYQVGYEAIRQARFEKQQKLGLFDESVELSPRDPQAKPWSELSAEKQADLAHRMAVYAAQVDCIDQNVGRLVNKLRELGQLENTIIFFLSDNGCSAEGGPGGFDRRAGEEIGTGRSYASAGLEWANVCDTPLRKFKIDTFEGGISSPLVVHWPKGLKNVGSINRTPGHVVDLKPTCLQLAGVDPKETPDGLTPLAGVSLLPALQGERNERGQPIFWEHQGNRAMRLGDWKIVSPGGKAWQIYNLAADRTELNNLADRERDRLIAMRSQWEAWAKDAGVEPWPVRRRQR